MEMSFVLIASTARRLVSGLTLPEHLHSQLMHTVIGNSLIGSSQTKVAREASPMISRTSKSSSMRSEHRVVRLAQVASWLLVIRLKSELMPTQSLRSTSNLMTPQLRRVCKSSKIYMELHISKGSPIANSTTFSSSTQYETEGSRAMLCYLNTSSLFSSR